MLVSIKNREIWPNLWDEVWKQAFPIYNLVMGRVQYPIGFIVADGVQEIIWEKLDVDYN